jgi:hypothetical protein
VGYTENVILYREHLTDGLVSGGEAVPKQLETHSWNGNTHSNIHIGDMNVGSTPSASVEVDYHIASSNLRSQDWADEMEDNLEMYGINANIEIDENRQAQEVPDEWPGNQFVWKSYDRGHATNKEIYVLVSPGNAFGKSAQTKPITRDDILVFSERQRQQADNLVNQNDIQNSGYNNQTNFVMAKATLHEIGHTLHIGEADDDCGNREIPNPILNEVYSGSNDDCTYERQSYNQGHTDRWSIMRSGYGPQLTLDPVNGSYFAYSIEELLTIE